MNFQKSVAGMILGLSAIALSFFAWGTPILQVQALDIELDTSGIEEDICDALNGEDDEGVIQCDEEEGSSFTDFEGDFSAPDEEGYAEGITTTDSAREFIVNVTNFVLSFLGLAAVVVIIYGGFLYVTAAGEQEQADKGKKSVYYAVIGIIVVLISYALVNTIIQGAASGEDSTSSTGLYNSGTISGESLSEFQSAELAESVQELAEELLTSYTRFININAILEAMAQVAVFNEDGLSELDEGFNLILNEVESLSDTADYAREANQTIQPYTSFNWNNTWKAFFNLSDWMEASAVMLAVDGEDTTVTTDDGSTSAEELFEACYEETCPSSGSVLDPDFLACLSDCADEASTVAYADPYDVGDTILDYMASTSEASKDEFIEDLSDISDQLTQMQESFEDMTIYDYFTGVTFLLALESLEDFYIADTYTYTYLEDGEKTITLYENGPLSSGYVADILEQLNLIYGLIQELEFTTAVITANTDEGNEPLIVTFDALDSSDPTNLTIPDENYEWDLDGDGTFETTGPTATYTYEEAGTYVAALRVTSNTPETIAAGISYLTIKVSPPSSIINLTATVEIPEVDTITLKDNEEGVDELTWTLTGEQAKAGVTFDASGTEDGEGNTDTIVDFDFDFGDGEYQSGENAIAIHYYTEEGTYDFILEVTDQNGTTDRAIVAIEVNSPAAYIEASETTAEIGESVLFDASGSVTDNGSITDYEWTIEKETASGMETVYGPDVGEDELEYTFESPGTYTVSVTVTDSEGQSDENSVNVTVSSTPPVATFAYQIYDSTTPNRVYFNGLKSYDPDEGDTLTYEWSIAGVIEGTDYTFAEETDASSERPIVEFAEVGDYEVTLTVYDQHEGSLQQNDSYTQTVSVESILGISVEDASSDGIYILQEQSESSSVVGVEATLSLNSNSGVSYKVYWADGDDAETIPVTSVGTAVSANHMYTEAGTYAVQVTVYDSSGNTNDVTHNIYIGNGLTPIPVIDVTIGGLSFADETDITGNRKTSFRFDASRSVDVQGEALPNDNINWDFGDGTLGDGDSVTHIFDELGTYTVTLTVVSETASTGVSASATVDITIENEDPVIYGLTVQAQDDELVTPLSVKVTVEAEDPDAENPSAGIVQYKYWYYDINNSSEKLDEQIALTSSAYLTVNTNGSTGEEIEYAFAVEVVDSENNTVNSDDVLEEDQIPTLTVENGVNQAPIAELDADRTNVLLGESVTFTAAASDDDGEIDEYIWDVEGDGFYNNESTSESTLTYTFETTASSGIDVRVKVVDNGGATGVSDPIRIYVDSLTEDPEAAFLSETDNLTVTFTNNSVADADNGAELTGYMWDFDTSVDSDGNGEKDDDTDSTEQNPSQTYDDYGDYEVKLSVVDSEGNTDEVSQTVTLVATDPPEAAFTYEVAGLVVTFANNSSVEGSGVSLSGYSWDFDTATDSDGNGTEDDDVDSATQNPTATYEEYGNYKVQLIVTDSLGRTDNVSQTVAVEQTEEELIAYLTSSPEADPSDGKIHIDGSSGDITFTFSSEGTSGTATYCIDKNAYYDSDGDGDKDNDCNKESTTAGTYTTDFEESWGMIVVKLTVTDDTDRSDTVTLEVEFDEEETTGSTSILPVTSLEALYILATALGFTLLGAKLYIRRDDTTVE